MNGAHVKEHHVIQLSPTEAGALRALLEDVRDAAKDWRVGLTELQDEVAEGVVKVLELGDGEDSLV